MEFVELVICRVGRLPSLQCAVKSVGRVCLVGLRGGARTVLQYVRIVDRFFSKTCCVCRVVSRSGTFPLPVSEVH